MTNIGHFRAAAEIWRGQKFNPAVRTWICPPTRMDQEKLKEEAAFSVYSAMGARLEIAGEKGGIRIDDYKFSGAGRILKRIRQVRPEIADGNWPKFDSADAET